MQASKCNQVVKNGGESELAERKRRKDREMVIIIEKERSRKI